LFCFFALRLSTILNQTELTATDQPRKTLVNEKRKDNGLSSHFTIGGGVREIKKSG